MKQPSLEELVEERARAKAAEEHGAYVARIFFGDKKDPKGKNK
jgi:hypothetical protein